MILPLHGNQEHLIENICAWSDEVAIIVLDTFGCYREGCRAME